MDEEDERLGFIFRKLQTGRCPQGNFFSKLTVVDLEPFAQIVQEDGEMKNIFPLDAGIGAPNDIVSRRKAFQVFQNDECVLVNGVLVVRIELQEASGVLELWNDSAKDADPDAKCEELDAASLEFAGIGGRAEPPREKAQDPCPSLPTEEMLPSECFGKVVIELHTVPRGEFGKFQDLFNTPRDLSASFRGQDKPVGADPDPSAALLVRKSSRAFAINVRGRVRSMNRSAESATAVECWK